MGWMPIAPCPIITLPHPALPYMRADARLVGFWRDTPEARTWTGGVADLPWPGDHCDKTMHMQDRERIAAALDAVPVVAQYRGCALDRLNPLVVVGSGDQAIAGWRFPEGLSHYVSAYGLVLPTEFLAAVGAVRPRE